MHRLVAVATLILIAGCTAPSAPDPAAVAGEREAFIEDIRARAAVQRRLAEAGGKGQAATGVPAEAARVTAQIASGETRTLVTGAIAPEATHAGRLFKVCNDSGLASRVRIDIFPFGEDVGREHPSVAHQEVDAATCVFAQGRRIDASRGPETPEEREASEKASDWLASRIRALQAEIATEANPRKREAAIMTLDEYLIRSKGPDPSKVVSVSATAVDG